MVVVQEEEQLVPQERVRQWTVEQVPMPQFLEETVEVVRLIPQERVQWIDDEMVEVPIPQIVEETGEESVDVQVPEALQLQKLVQFVDMFSGREPCLAGIHELRRQLDECFRLGDVASSCSGALSHCCSCSAIFCCPP